MNGFDANHNQKAKMILIRLDLTIDHFVQVGSWTKEKSDLVFVADRSMDQLVVYRSLYRDILAENVANQ